MLGALLGPENTEINIEIIPVLRSFQETGRSRHKQTITHKRHRESRGHSLGAGETLGSLGLLRGLWRDE